MGAGSFALHLRTEAQFQFLFYVFRFELKVVTVFVQVQVLGAFSNAGTERATSLMQEIMDGRLAGSSLFMER